MTNEEFRNELWIHCYEVQIDGYPLGHPKRTNFRPIVTTFPAPDGSIDRKRTLESVSYSGWQLSDDDRALLMQAD